MKALIINMSINNCKSSIGEHLDQYQLYEAQGKFFFTFETFSFLLYLLDIMNFTIKSSEENFVGVWN